MFRSIRWSRRNGRWLIVAAILGLLLANVLIVRHARAFLVYSTPNEPMGSPESLSGFGKLRLLVTGVSVPRPVNASDPATRGMPFHTHRLEQGAGWLELWHVPAPGPVRGVVLLFPGYGAAKASLLPEAEAFQKGGFDTILADFRGAGGSSGQDTTLGIREAEDVAAVHRYATERWPSRPIVLFGRSMGAAAVLRAVARNHVVPAAVIVEGPFDRMINAVRNRFRAIGVPSFPAAELLVFWGGQRLGFNGFAHNSAEDARAVHVPSLVLGGSVDSRATPIQVQAVYENLAGPKHWHLFAEVGHEPFLGKCPEQWSGEVATFLDAHVR